MICRQGQAQLRHCSLKQSMSSAYSRSWMQLDISYICMVLFSSSVLPSNMQQGFQPRSSTSFWCPSCVNSSSSVPLLSLGIQNPTRSRSQILTRASWPPEAKIVGVLGDHCTFSTAFQWLQNLYSLLEQLLASHNLTIASSPAVRMRLGLTGFTATVQVYFSLTVTLVSARPVRTSHTHMQPSSLALTNTLLEMHLVSSTSHQYLNRVGFCSMSGQKPILPEWSPLMRPWADHSRAKPASKLWSARSVTGNSLPLLKMATGALSTLAASNYGLTSECLTLLGYSSCLSYYTFLIWAGFIYGSGSSKFLLLGSSTQLYPYFYLVDVDKLVLSLA